MRGEILNAINAEKIDVFGGDLSQSLDRRSPYKIQDEKFNYYLPTLDYTNVNQIYSDSKFSINISSFQMDGAVNNRIIDVASSGGFLLSDKKNDLEKISPILKEITFSTANELNELIEKYLSNNNLYKEVKELFFNSIFNKFTYRNQVNEVINLSH
jgi:spore maturation protein CgeB